MTTDPAPFQLDPRDADHPSDEMLLARFVSGDDDALGLLAQRYERPMVGLARGLVGTEDLAREAVQDTWVRVIRFAGGYDGRASVKTWMYTILTNKCRDLRRTERARSKRERTRRPPTRAMMVRTDDARIAEAVGELEEPGRETLVLCFCRGMTHSQAAAILDVPIGTVKSRVHKAMARLRERLGADGAGSSGEVSA
ncbi:MAG: RNA polymerase sigma factor [Planctomycetota bacterium]